MEAPLQLHTPGYLVITPRRLIKAFTPSAWRSYGHGYRLGMLPGAHNHITFDAPVAFGGLGDTNEEGLCCEGRAEKSAMQRQRPRSFALIYMERHGRDEKARGFRITKQGAGEGHGRGIRLCLNRRVFPAFPLHGWGLCGFIFLSPPTFDHDATHDDMTMGFVFFVSTRPYWHAKVVRMRTGFPASTGLREQSREAGQARRRSGTKPG